MQNRSLTYVFHRQRVPEMLPWTKHLTVSPFLTGAAGRLSARPPQARGAPWGAEAGARRPGARGALRSAQTHRRARTRAPADSRPPRTPARTRTRGRRAPDRLRGGRERESARNPWNEAPPALTRALRAPRAQPGPPGHAPGVPRPPSRWGPAQKWPQSDLP